MSDINGVFKEIKEEELFDEKNKNSLNYGDISLYDFQKKKRPFSFLKWFKKNKNNSQLQALSAESTPTFERKKKSSCESLDTIFSTQTVRSFAYIPSSKYQPSAPPSELFDFNKYEENNNSESKKYSGVNRPESEIFYNRKKKRKAPSPPKLNRKNSLPIVLRREKADKEFDDCVKTRHRRTVSDSFKDKEKPNFRYVQGKRKAPQPPTKAIPSSNNQKVSTDYQSLSRKKKAAPPPPSSEPKANEKLKNPFDNDTDVFVDNRKKERNSELYDLSICDKPSAQNNQNELNIRPREKNETKNQSETAKSPKVLSSPLASRPWYKRSHKHSQESSASKNVLAKGIEKRKSKKGEDWMIDMGFSMKNLLLDSNYSNRFSIFSKLEKSDEKKKEEKRKSQISILTNISELDREAAEILKKEQAAEKRMIEAKDARFYGPNYFSHMYGTKMNQEAMMQNTETDKSVLESDNYKKRHDRKKQQENTFPEKSYENPIYIKKIDGDSNIAAGIKNSSPKTETQSNAEFNRTIPEEINSVQENKKIKSVATNVEKESDSPNVTPKLFETQQPSSQLSTNLGEKSEKKETNNFSGPWICQKCTLENPSWKVFCEICNSIKPHSLYNTESEKLYGLNVKPQQKFQKPAPQSVLENANLSFRSEVTESIAINNEPEKEKLNIVSENTENSQTQKKIELKNDSKNNYDKDIEITKSDDLNEKKEIQKPDKYSKDSEHNKISDQGSSSLLDKLQQIKKEQEPMQNSKENVAEAYIITTTTILEDIIIKKGNKNPKETPSAKSTVNFSNEESGYSSPKKYLKDHPKMPKLEPKSLITSSKERKVNEGINLVEKNDYSQAEDVGKLSKNLTGVESLANFKTNLADIQADKSGNIEAVNKLLKKLEEALKNGEETLAAELSKELAHLIVTLKIQRQMSAPSTSGITVYMHVEDKASHRGPFEIQVLPSMTLLQLKKKVYKEFGFPMNVQRWILGKQLATEDNKTLESHGIKNNFSSLFLYLVAPEKSNKVSKNRRSLEASKEVKSSPITEKEKDMQKKKRNHSISNENLFIPIEEAEEKKSESHNSFIVHSSKIINDTEVPSSSGLKENMFSVQNSQAQENGKNLPSAQKSESFNQNLNNFNEHNQLPLDLEKTKTKFIPKNSVKQKVEQINRNSSNFYFVPPEKWKCLKCNFLNSPERLNCFTCKSKKIDSKLAKFDVQKSMKEINITKDYADKVVEKPEEGEPEGHYKALIDLEESDLVSNTEPFNCPVCLADYVQGQGIVLKNCLHTFCRACLVDTVKYSEDAEVKCPFMDMAYSCTSVLQEREIKALVPKKIFESHLAKSVKEAESNIENAFHCKTSDCKGWCIYEDNVNEFYCPVCKLINCLTCQAIHTGINCKEYQEEMKNASESDVDAKKTKILLEEMVEKGEAIVCPKCQVVLMKKWGCDWLKCSMCKTEICWVTRNFRWGPAGKGDTSGGCKCGVNGIKCHPKCNYCH